MFRLIGILLLILTSCKSSVAPNLAYNYEVFQTEKSISLKDLNPQNSTQLDVTNEAFNPNNYILKITERQDSVDLFIASHSKNRFKGCKKSLANNYPKKQLSKKKPHKNQVFIPYEGDNNGMTVGVYMMVIGLILIVIPALLGILLFEESFFLLFLVLLGIVILPIGLMVFLISLLFR